MIEVRKELAAITERLRASQIPSSHGVTINPEGGTSRNYGNAVVGMRNPIAPPLDITWHEDGLVTTDFHLRSEEHTSELQSLMRISYAVFCLNKKQHKTADIILTTSRPI